MSTMRSTCSFGLVVCLVASSLPVMAQRPAEVQEGPISRSLAREAARLAASGELAASARASAQAGDVAKPLELRWNELAPMVAAQRVEVALADGRIVKGEAIAVRDEALLVDAATKPKGSTSIPRVEISQITVKRTNGSGGRIAGTILGVFVGTWIAGYTATSVTDSAGVGVPLFIGLTTLISVGGYYAGKSADTKVTRITIIP